MEDQESKKVHKRWWVWVLAGLGLFVLIGSFGESSGQTGSTNEANIQAPTSSTEKSNIPAEYKSALIKAGSYATIMHMSKRGVYQQLTSEYGEKFTPEAAQYAVDNVKADWNANALIKARDYQNIMHLSPARIHDQLTSEYGEKFTQAEADYAIEHLND